MRMRDLLLILAMINPLNATDDKRANTPDWYLENRVHWHWECPATGVEAKGGAKGWIKWLRNVHQTIHDGGAKVSVASGRYRAEGAWWPSEHGDIFDPLRGHDVLKEHTIDQYRDLNMNTIIYYSHDIDLALEQAHPEWICVGANQQKVRVPGGAEVYGDKVHQLCQNSPFREFTKKRLVEIAARGADGIYFDGNHMPEVCQCENCKGKFEKVKGRAFPAELKKGTRDYQDVAHFIGESLLAAFEEWKVAIKAANPDCMLIVSTSDYADFRHQYLSEAFANLGDANKSEYQKCFGGQQHHGGTDSRKMLEQYPDYWLMPRDLAETTEWLINRDIQGGVPPHIWLSGADKEDPQEILHVASTVVAHGGIAGIGMQPVAKYLPNYNEVFKMNDALAAFMKDARSYHHVVVHISDELKRTLDLEGGLDKVERYRHKYVKQFAPVGGAIKVLHDLNYPYATTSDHAIFQKSFSPETKAIIVPHYEQLSDELQRAIDQSGLEVIKIYEGWHLEANHGKLSKELRSRLPEASYSVSGPSHLFTSYMINDTTQEVLVNMVRDWKWFWIWDDQPGMIRKEEVHHQPIISDIKIMGPGEKSVLYPQGEAINAPIDICRFVKIKM